MAYCYQALQDDENISQETIDNISCALTSRR